MSRWNAAKKLWAVSRSLHEQRGGSVWRYFRDAVHCSRRHGASAENYLVLRFYELSDRQRGEYLTSGRSKAVDSALNRKAENGDIRKLGRKELFDRAFSELLGREFLYVPDCSFAEFTAFLDRHEECIIKPVAGTMGKGIEKLRCPEDREKFYERCCREKLLLEEVIVQHPALNEINPSCVNSVRVNAARDARGEVCLIGACLKCGGKGAVTDNFHSGGVAYPLDLENGRVCGPGRNNTDIREYTRHPATGYFMPGFALPFWEELKALVCQGMERVPSLGYVGWDIALTPEGPALIEGNVHWPGGNIIQFDRVGKYPLILSCLGEKNEKHTD